MANGKLLKYSGDSVLWVTTDMEYGDYLNEDGFYPVYFEYDSSWSIYPGFTVMDIVAGNTNQDISDGIIDLVSIPDPYCEVFESADNNFISAHYIQSSGAYLYEVYLNDSVLKDDPISKYDGQSFGRAGFRLNGKMFNFEFRIKVTN